jgi:hypothetical protein
MTIIDIDGEEMTDTFEVGYHPLKPVKITAATAVGWVLR